MQDRINIRESLQAESEKTRSLWTGKNSLQTFIYLLEKELASPLAIIRSPLADRFILRVKRVLENVNHILIPVRTAAVFPGSVSGSVGTYHFCIKWP